MKPTSNTTEAGYRQLANLVGLSWLHNELKKALTHKSFYPEKEAKSRAKMSTRKRRHIQDKKK